MSSTNRGRQRNRADNYPTPYWCLWRLFEQLSPPEDVVWVDPCCGEGSLIRAAEYLDIWPGIWIARDIRPEAVEKVRQRYPATNVEFGDATKQRIKIPRFVVTNPPFLLAEPIIHNLLLDRKFGLIAILQRLNFLGSAKRIEWLRKDMPTVYVLPNRPSFLENGQTDSIEYAWFVWDEKLQTETRLNYLANTPIEERKACAMDWWGKNEEK